MKRLVQSFVATLVVCGVVAATTNIHNRPPISSGGGSGTITAVNAGTGISTATDGGVVTVTATSGFGTPTIINQTNSASAQVMTWEFQNQFTNTTSGSETANSLITFPISGAQVTNDLAALNAAGTTRVTTSTATPTVAMPVRSDLLLITINADITTLTITGLSLDTDWHYQITMAPGIGAGAQVTLRPNGVIAGCPGKGLYVPGGTTGLTINAIILFDTTDASAVAGSTLDIWGAAGTSKFYSTSQYTISGAAGFWEAYTGVVTSTANITSLVTNGAFKAGTVVGVHRMRSAAN